MLSLFFGKLKYIQNPLKKKKSKTLKPKKKYLHTQQH